MMETTSESARSPFYAAQLALGATFMEEGGWFWTNGFGDLDAEYRAVRDDLGIWDVSPLVKWELTGRDALEAAALLHTNNIRGLRVGQVHYGAFCDAQGLMIDRINGNAEQRPGRDCSAPGNRRTRHRARGFPDRQRR